MAALLLLGGAVGLRQWGEAATGDLTAEQTNYDFGRVSMGGGLLKTRFTLAVRGPTQIEYMATN